YGFYYVIIAVEPCNLGGVFVELSYSFFWKVVENIIIFDWIQGDRCGRITSPKVPNTLEALLYNNEWVYSGPSADPITEDTIIYSTPEDFGKYFKILLEIAKQKGLELDFHGDYNKLRSQLLKEFNSSHNQRYEPGDKTIDIAIVSILAGDMDTGRKLLNEVVKAQNVDSPFAALLLGKSSDLQEFQAFIRKRVIAGRQIRQKQFPKLKVDEIPEIYRL
ncbi:MAG: hypothetical protein ACI3YK_05845, partial [Eubacteriales bacterium]